MKYKRMPRLVLILIAVFYSYVYAAENNSHDVIMVDIGSSGSRLHQYSFDLDSKNLPSNIQEIYTRSINPGLAATDLNQESINNYFDSLFADLNLHLGTKVYVYATAGMRLLSINLQQQYYSYVQNWFFAHKQFLDLVEARTISGTDEAVFAWLAVNYQLNKLQNPHEDLVGIMEVGGASTQIAFPVDIDTVNLVHFQIFNRDIRLFVFSFLGLGLNQFASSHGDLAACYVNNYPLPNGLLGIGDAYFCAQQLSKIIAEEYAVADIIAPAMQHNLAKSWYALGAIRYLVMQGFLSYANNSFVLQDLIQDVNNIICNKSWDDLHEITPHRSHAALSCFLGSYFYALSVNSYGIADNQNISWLDTSQNADWPLGALLALYALSYSISG